MKRSEPDRRWISVAIAASGLAVGASCDRSEPLGHATSNLAQTVLGTAQAFAVLGGSTVTNTGPTTVHGDLGVDPGLAVTGFPPGLVIGGTIHAGDAVALQAQADTTTAYDTLAAQAVTVDLTGQDLGGLTLTPGVYRFASSAGLTGQLTLDALGDPMSVFVFQIGSTLTTASNSSVLVTNSGSDCNVFWQVGSSATIGTTTSLKGNVVALTSITLNTGAVLSGRALARNGAVTLDTNDVTFVSCETNPGPGVDAGVPMPIDAGAMPADAPADAGCDAPVDAPAIDAACDAPVDAPVDAAACPDAPVATEP